MTDALINAVFAAVEQEKADAAAERGQFSLGELAATIATHDPALTVKAEIGGRLVGVDGVHSYRGYYSDLAIEIGGETSAGGLAIELRDAIGSTFTGYKGGDYTMSRLTPVWVDHYGSASGNAVTGVRVDEGTLILETTEEKW